MTGTEEARAAGWYPDPDDPAWLRHWDGRHWGGERRPRPAWAPPARPPDPTQRRARRRRWFLFATGGAGLAVLASLGLASLTSGPDIPPRSISDTSFIERATAECQRILPPLREARPETGRENAVTADETLAQVERATNGLEGLVAGLRALTVVPADQADVDGWLDVWDRYIAVGRRYETLLRRGEGDRALAVANEGGPIARELFGFAVANDLRPCAP